MALACENGTKPPSGQTGTPKTAFELAWIEKMKDPIVLAHVTFLPGPAPASGSSGSPAPGSVVLSPGPQSEVNKLKRALEQSQNRVRNLTTGKKGKGAGKGRGNKGKGKGKPKGGRTPTDIGDFSATTNDGRRICFGYNRSGGCPLAKSGAECSRGWHICARCHGVHGAPNPCSG